MADIFAAEKRSWLMARVRQHDTTPERLVRKLLHGRGFRFTIKGPKNRSLPGRPDIVLPKYKAVVFVHGCFWHGHSHCALFRIPQNRREWWKNKFEGNRSRDRRVAKQLRRLGWKVITIWQCELRDRRQSVATDRLVHELKRAAEDRSRLHCAAHS